MDDFQFHVKLPVPKPLFDHLSDVPKRITFEKFVIDNEIFPSFFKPRKKDHDWQEQLGLNNRVCGVISQANAFCMLH